MKQLLVAAAIAASLALPVLAQQPAVPNAAAPGAGAMPDTAKAPPKLAELAWLEGCWTGSVNKRDYREVWLPLRGNMMVGVSQTVLDGKTEDFEYLRIETRGDATFYVAAPGGRNESAFRLVQANDEPDGSRTFVFMEPARDFPQRISYRRGTGGWLYAEVAGKVEGKDRVVVYPMRRIDCALGSFIEK